MTPVLTAISAVCALVYGVWFCHRDPSHLRSFVKTAAIAFLAFVGVIADGPVLLTMALAFSALGDFALSRMGERLFLIGLCSFALTPSVLHRAFRRSGPWMARDSADPFSWSICHLDRILARTAHRPITRTGQNIRDADHGDGLAALALPGSLIWAMTGAGAFVASDTLLAVTLFLLSPQSRWQMPFACVLWLLYYGAQALITWALLG